MTESNVATQKPITKRHLFRLMGAWAIGIGAALQLMGWWLWAPLLHVGWPIIGVGAIWLVLTPWMSTDPVRPAVMRYLRAGLPAMGGYVVALFVIRLAREWTLPMWGMILLALLPVLPMAWMVFAMWRLTRDSDELERRVTQEAAFITCGVAGLLTFAAGLLQVVGVLHAGKWLIFVLPLIFFVYGIAVWWCRRKYGIGGMC